MFRRRRAHLEDPPRHPRAPSWLDGKQVLESALAAAAPPGATVETGRVRTLGAGLSHHAFGAYVEVRPDPGGLTGGWVAVLPSSSPSSDALPAEDEARLLGWLLEHNLPLRIATTLPAGPGELVHSFVSGLPVDFRRLLRPWEHVGDVAATVHRLRPPAWLRGFPTRRAHALDAMMKLEGIEEPECRDALAWSREHLPDDEPSSLLHGDLQWQNILIAGEDEPPGLIDWEYAQAGDPGHELAIVTRGVKGPFKRPDGHALLVEAYTEAGGHGVTVEHIHLYELALIAGWYRAALAGEGAEPPAEYLANLRRVLARVG